MTIEEKLDLVLNEIKDHYGHKPIPANWERICRLVTDGDGVSTGNNDYHYDPQLKNIFDCLLEEKYIKKFQNIDGDPVYYVSTIKGLKFEGFTNQKSSFELEQIELNSLKTLEKRLKEKVVVQNRWLIGIGILAGLYSFLEVIKFLYSWYHL